MGLLVRTVCIEGTYIWVVAQGPCPLWIFIIVHARLALPPLFVEALTLPVKKCLNSVLYTYACMCNCPVCADDLQAEVASLKVQIDALNQEKEIDLRRIEELISQSARLELGNKTL